MGVGVKYYFINIITVNGTKLYLSYEISLALWVVGIDVPTFSVVISSHAVANLMSEGVVTNGKAL